MTDRELMQQALDALNRSDYLGWQLNIPIIKALRERLAQPEQEPVALEAVYETIIQWDEGGGKRSRRELARRIVDLYTTPPPCPTCEALARTVMLDQTSHDNFKQRILELEALLERQTALLEQQTTRIVDLQTHIDNFEGEDR